MRRLALTLVGVLFLLILLFNVTAPSSPNSLTGSVHSKGWVVVSKSGAEAQLTFWKSGTDKKVELGWIPPNNDCTGWTDRYIYGRDGNRILDDKNKDILVKCETAKCSGANCYHISLTTVQAVNINDYIKLGENSIVTVYQEESKIAINDTQVINGVETTILCNHTIYRYNGSDYVLAPETIFVYPESDGLKSGANDSLAGLHQYKYVTSCNYPLEQLSTYVYGVKMTDRVYSQEVQFQLAGTTITAPINTFDLKGHSIDYSNLTNFQNTLEFQLSNNVLTIYFNESDGIIDPIDKLWSSINFTGAYSVGVFDNNNDAKNDTIVMGGTGSLYAYDKTGLNIWNYTFSTSASSQVYAMKPFYNGSQWFIPFMPNLNTTSQTFLYILNSSGNLVCRSDDIVTAATGTGGGADLDTWDVEKDSKIDDIAILYDDGGKNGRVASYFLNCTQLFSTIVTTAAGTQTAGIVAQGAHIYSGDFDADGYKNQVAALNCYATPAAPPAVLTIINQTGGKTWQIAGLPSSGAAGLNVGNFTSDLGDEVIAGGRTGAVYYMYNGTGSLKYTSAILPTTDHYYVPVGQFGGNGFDSMFFPSTTTMTMFNKNLTNALWTTTVAGGTTKGGAVSDFTGDGLNDVCVGVGTYVHCWNQAGGYIGNYSINTGVGNVWGHYSMGMMKSTDCGYSGNCLLGVDQAGYLYMWNLSGIPSVPDTIKPNVTFNYQIPPDLNLSNFIGVNGVNISYNISDNVAIDVNTVKLYYKSNSTTSDVMYYQNGTAHYGYFSDPTGVNYSNVWVWNLKDNQVLPATYNYGEVTMENTVHSISTLTSQIDYLSVQLINVSKKRYSFYEIMANKTANVITGSLRFYYCNSTYDFNSNVATNTNCVNFFSTINTSYNHRHTNYSSHLVVPFPIDETTGKIGSVYVTPTSYFMIRGSLVMNFNYYYINVDSGRGAFKTTTNNGGTWTTQAYTVDAHLHQFTLNDSIWYYACANDTSGNQNCTSPRQDLFELAGLNPSSPDVYSPTAGNYSGFIPINYTSSLSPNGYNINFYNISLLNNDSSFNMSIRTNNSLNLSYSWNSSLALDGNYIVRVEACDNMSQCSSGYSEIFYVDNTPPYYLNFQNNASTYTQKNGYVNWSITLLDGHGLNWYFFAYNDSGTMKNVSNGSVSGTSQFVNVTMQITKPKGNFICGQFWVNDSAGNQNQTNLSCLTVFDLTFPSITNLINRTIDTGSTTFYTSSNIYCNATITDDTGLSTVIFSWNDSSGVWHNETPTNISSFYSFNLTSANLSSAGDKWLAWRYYANDTSGNMNISELVFFFVNPLLVPVTPPSGGGGGGDTSGCLPYVQHYQTCFYINNDGYCIRGCKSGEYCDNSLTCVPEEPRIPIQSMLSLYTGIGLNYLKNALSNLDKNVLTPTAIKIYDATLPFWVLVDRFFTYVILLVETSLWGSWLVMITLVLLFTCLFWVLVGKRRKKNGEQNNHPRV